jgi:c(7)-type cytochrome triheme protein
LALIGEGERTKTFQENDMSGKCLWITVALFLTFATSLLQAQPDQIQLDHTAAFGSKQRTSVTFPHMRHIETGLSCKDCHHRYDQGKNVLEESDLNEGTPNIRCSECHSSASRFKLREAFHRQCMDCHSKKKTGPRFCGECHRK